MFATFMELRSQLFVHSQEAFLDAVGHDFDFALALSTGLRWVSGSTIRRLAGRRVRVVS